MSDSNEERVNLFDTAIGSIKHYTYDGSFFVRAEKVTAETVGIPPDEWDAILSQDSKNRRRPPVTTLNERAPSTKALYEPIQGDYETRILEIKPGSGSETLQGALHHCWLDGDRLALDYARQWGVSTSDFTTPVCYTALSYTWGPPVFEATIKCDGHAKRITRGLEAALKQFRQPHDSIMMWIDQICINQDDDAEKKKQIPLMGRIYERARSTVIWLGEAGNGSSSALKLIERITSILHFTLSEFAHSVYQASGPFSKIMLREREIKKPIMKINDEKNELTIQGVFFDTLIDIGTLFTNPDLSNENPTTENQTLLEAVAFVSQLKQAGSEYNVFTALWKSLVAGKNGDGKLRSPESFAEVFSFLLDQTTGKSPSVPGQTYSIRQRRPRGKGGLELSSLETRTLGQTFQEVRTALKRALKNRRLGITNKGYLGLFPGHVKKGDVVYVFETCALPSALRSAGNGKFRFIGECFVYGIMEGEAVEAEDTCRIDVTLV
ncbi:hypothetical protein CDV31_008708 [Fusarium ambrosium]|uniref:Heterokaryon incompatibility domain-containing protein n=1 Tax=Fusarium ambrosium TaxID=131363 RepID=A0A428TYT2_9HYPO|nr:hypothetical protein CDV31_008708 [Fusarium ambrosium]